MKVGGFGELENIRKAIHQEESRRPAAANAGTGEPDATRGDAVQISQQARLLGKLRQIPEIRQDEIDRIMQKIKDGTLLTPEAVRMGVANLLKNVL